MAGDLNEESSGSDAERQPDVVEEGHEEQTPKRKRKRNRKKKSTEGQVEITESKTADVEPKAIQELAEEKTANTAYVEGIPYNADEGDLASHFADCGTIKQIRLPRYQDSGKIRGYAHIVFDSSDSVSKALRLSGSTMMGRYLSVKLPLKPRAVTAATQKKASKRPRGCRTIFVKNLPYELTEDELKTAFSPCGEIASVRLGVWNNTKKLKGFGYVTFKTEMATEAAGKKTGMRIGDRLVIVDFDTSAPKASFRTREGIHWSKTEEAKSLIEEKKAAKSERKSDRKMAEKKPKNGRGEGRENAEAKDDLAEEKRKKSDGKSSKRASSAKSTERSRTEAEASVDQPKKKRQKR